MRQEASCFCEAKVSPVALSANPVTVNWLSDKRYLCVRINYQAGSFSRQSKSRYDRRLSFEKSGMYSSTNQNLVKVFMYPRYIRFLIISQAFVAKKQPSASCSIFKYLSYGILKLNISLPITLRADGSVKPI